MASTGTRTVSRPLRIGSQFGACGAGAELAGGFDLAAAAQLGQQVHELVALGHGGALLDQLAHVRERGGEPRIVDGLEHIVDGARLEGLHRETIVGGDEHDHRQLVRLQLGQHVEARQPRHLDVEEHEVGLLFADRVERLAAVAALPDDLDVVGHAQAQLQTAPRQRLIVDQQGAYLARSQHGLCRRHFQGQPELDAQARLVVEGREAMAVVVQHREPLARVAQADAAARAGRRARC